jgi:hypothetical protein
LSASELLETIIFLKTLSERFFYSIGQQPFNQCWSWRGFVQINGYGRIGKGPRGSGYYMAHRAAWLIFYGSIPDGLVIDHLCRNRACVNPTHLRVCTQRENILAGTGASAENILKTVCPQGHSLSDAYIVTHANGNRSRKCRQCKRKQGKSYYDKLKAAS